ncbi:MAG: DNA polymerase III subunit alpha [Bacteroidales bacterium]|nr:DNA polymerase III subunit alpha [Bacteroidales bacterium]
MYFAHLHVHSHYSILDGMSKIPDLVKKCKKDGMYAMALTDHGNMFGIKELFDFAKKENGKVKDAVKEQKAVIANEEATEEERAAAKARIEELEATFFKPILGIETYCAHEHRTVKTHRDGWHLILLAKNKQGYHNLCKLSSIAYTEGYYYNPRIDHELLQRYHEGLICCSACLGGEVPQKILMGDMAGAEASVLWFKQLFGDDYYLELQRHKTDKPNAATDTFEKQQRVNAVLVELAAKHGIKLIATNDVHFVEEEHGEAHDRLICLSTGKDFGDPSRLHYTKQEWLKSPEQMAAIFADMPEALENTREIVDKVEEYDINSNPIMPAFPIPESFGTEEGYRQRIAEEELLDEFARNDKGEPIADPKARQKLLERLGGYEKLYRIKLEADYLGKLVWDGAHRRYGDELSDEIKERIGFELHTIKTMGFPGYFLIVQDYIRGAREELGVSVGPGRGSAAGSVVAYCLWITDVDPLKYDLLFERFLNPDRISLPDIDVDFDDAGRGRVLDWITHKYGKERVAHIITYGTMATKSSVADVGRVQKIPLATVNYVKSLIPDRGFPDNVKDEKGNSPKVNLHNCYKYVPQLKSIMESASAADLELKEVLTYAEELEDTNRQIGIHACGVIIGADDLTNFAPLCTIKDKETDQDVLVTQYDGHVVEEVGLIKMDFLGLKNLTIIKDALRNIKHSHRVDVDIDHIPIDDELTYKLFGDGATVGTFQFESAGMQKYLRELKPHVFEDLIAMNALYRPGPMEYIPDFIDRKMGRKPIEYDIPCMEQYLKDTYGITVYQEQVMLLSRQLANFTRGQSDTLRKAMGKKQIAKMNELEVLFYEGGEKNGHPKEKLQKIWEDWKKFASYAFNKSHATCYSWVAYQTGYLKAHYPAEYMAAVLTSGLSDITRTTQLLEECKRMKLSVLRPSVNLSEKDFSVDSEGNIRFGLCAIKGMGEAAAEALIKERDTNGPFKSAYDFVERIDLRTVNRKSVESLIMAGALDDFEEPHRAQYFVHDTPSESSPTYVERLLRWASRKQESEESSQMSIFDMCDEMKSEEHPLPPAAEEWTNVERCRYEKEVVGFYLSGHPLNDFKDEINFFAKTPLSAFANMEALVDSPVSFAGIVTEAKTAVSSKDGNTYGRMVVEDFSGSHELVLFGEEFQKYKNYFEKGIFLYCNGKVEQKVFRVGGKDSPGGGEERKSRPRLRISQMMLLNNVMTTLARSLTLEMSLANVTDDFCDRIENKIKKNKGKSDLRIRVNDIKNGLTLTMQSTTGHVDIRNFLNDMSTLPEIERYTISK